MIKLLVLAGLFFTKARPLTAAGMQAGRYLRLGRQAGRKARGGPSYLKPEQLSKDI